MSILNEDVKDLMRALVSKVGSRDNQRYISQILSSVVHMAIAPQTKTGMNAADWKLLSRATKEFQQSFHLFSEFRDKRKVCIFGSARTKPEDPDYQFAERTAALLTENDLQVITGAGGGIMEAGNKGALEGESYGMNIHLPFEQSPNPYIDQDPKLLSYRYFFIRKLMFIKESDATILFPGGYGTMDEAYEGLTLLQTGKSMPRPVILACHSGSRYWEEWVSFFTELMLPLGYISKDDLDLFTICHTEEDIKTAIQNFYKNYHSLRYVGSKTVLRLHEQLSDSALDALNEEFSDIIVDGRIEKSEPLKEELDSKDQLRKARLAFHFNKVNFGRLVTLIRRVNALS